MRLCTWSSLLLIVRESTVKVGTNPLCLGGVEEMQLLSKALDLQPALNLWLEELGGELRILRAFD